MTMWDQVTSGERDALVLAIVTALPTSNVPHHLRAPLVRYFADGVLPENGSLLAMLCNDLRAAILRLEVVPGQHYDTLVSTVEFLTEWAPARAWGSRDSVRAWTTTPDRLGGHT